MTSFYLPRRKKGLILYGIFNHASQVTLSLQILIDGTIVKKTANLERNIVFLAA